MSKKAPAKTTKKRPSGKAPKAKTKQPTEAPKEEAPEKPANIVEKDGELLTWPLEKAKSKMAEWNPRKITAEELDRLHASKETFGILLPIVYNKTTDTIIAGHQRLKVYEEAGMKEVELFVVEVPADKEKLAAVALNEEAGVNDAEKLAHMLRTDLKQLKPEALLMPREDVARLKGTLARARTTTAYAYTIFFDHKEKRQTWLRFLVWLRENVDGEGMAEKFLNWFRSQHPADKG